MRARQAAVISFSHRLEASRKCLRVFERALLSRLQRAFSSIVRSGLSFKATVCLNEDFSIEIKFSERRVKSLDCFIVRVENLHQ